MKKIAILTFPGMNCEVETLRVIRRSGFDGRIFLWNENIEDLHNFDGVVLPGGFSFEDRGRSGVIAAKEPILKAALKMSLDGKPILGICNGAQVLVEAGLAPGFEPGSVEMSLARNKRISADGEVLGTGFYHAWVYLKNTAPKGRSAFNDFGDDIILKMPVAHGEGRFLTDDKTLKVLIDNHQNVFTFCDQNGCVSDQFPINPNGSLYNMAGICNLAGNVLAIMPHPERTDTCDIIFKSMHNWFIRNQLHSSVNLSSFTKQSSVSPKKHHQASVEFFISLKITDNTEKTMEKAMQKVINRKDIILKRMVYWGMEVDHDDFQELALKMASSGELFNENKENAFCRINGRFYKYVNQNFEPISLDFSKHTFLAHDFEDFVGREKKETLDHQGDFDIEKINHGILWQIYTDQPLDIDQLSACDLLVNPVAGEMIEFA